MVDFTDHTYYDPSYGIGEYTDRKRYEQDALAGSIEDLGGGDYDLKDLPADDGNPGNHGDEICNYPDWDF